MHSVALSMGYQNTGDNKEVCYVSPSFPQGLILHTVVSTGEKPRVPELVHEGLG